MSDRPGVRRALAAQALFLAALLAFWWRSPSAWPEWAWLPDSLLVVAAAAATSVGLPRFVRPPVVLAAAAVILSSFAAPDAHAALASCAAWARIFLAAVAAGALATTPGGPRRLAWTLAVAGAAMAADGALQVFFVHPALARAPGLSPGEIAQLADARANAVFLLPAHLAGFLAAALAASAGLLADALARRRSAGQPARGATVGAATCALCGIAGLALAGSMGGAVVAGIALATFGVLALGVRARLVVGVAALVVVTVLVGESRARRRQEIAREDPGGARAANWASAARLIRESPLCGHGGGSYGLEHERVRGAGENDAQHAHEGYLEAAAEHGVVMLPLFAILVASVAGAAWRARGQAEAPFVSAGLAAGTAAVLAHALLDFGWSDPAWAVPAAVLVGAGLVSPSARGLRPAWGGALVVALAALLLASSIPRSLAQAVAARAMEAGRAGDHATARVLLAKARRLDPLDAGLAASRATASLALAATTPEGDARAELLADASREAGEAAALSPRSPSARILHARALVAQGRRLEALAEASRAAQLAPGRAEARELRDGLVAEAAR